MNEQLEKAIERVRALPDAEQEALAAMISERFPDGKRREARSVRPFPGPVIPLGMAPGDPVIEIPEDADWDPAPGNSERICEHIKALIETSRVSEARRLVSGIPPGVSEELDYWKKVLAEPVVRVTKPRNDGDPKKDILWIEKNADKYKGKWVALKSGELLGSDESLIKLHHTLKQSGRITGSFVFRIGN